MQKHKWIKSFPNAYFDLEKYTCTHCGLSQSIAYEKATKLAQSKNGSLNLSAEKLINRYIECVSKDERAIKAIIE